MNLLALSSLFLANDATVIGLGVGLGVGVLIALVIGFFVGYIINQKRTDKRLGDVETRTKKMIDDASLECKALKKEAILEYIKAGTTSISFATSLLTLAKTILGLVM